MAVNTVTFKATTNTNHNEKIAIGNNNYILKYQYNISQDTWSLSIYQKITTQADIQNLIPLVLNITIVTGTNLLKQFSYLGLGELYFWSIDQESVDRPTAQDLQINFLASWIYEV